MLEDVRISVERDRERRDVSTLVLTSSNGKQWTKRYHGDLFLLFDAEELGLIVEETSSHADRPKKSLRREALLDISRLERLHFSERH